MVYSSLYPLWQPAWGLVFKRWSIKFVKWINESNCYPVQRDGHYFKGPEEGRTCPAADQKLVANRKRSQGDRGGVWEGVLLLPSPTHVNLLNPQLFRDSALLNETREPAIEWMPPPCSKFFIRTSNQKWEVELEVGIRATLLNFKAWLKRKVETAIWIIPAQNLPLHLEK